MGTFCLVVLVQLLQGLHRKVQGHESMAEELDLSIFILLSNIRYKYCKILTKFLVSPHPGVQHLGFLEEFCKIYVFFYFCYLLIVHISDGFIILLVYFLHLLWYCIHPQVNDR